ncbi:MAG: glycosyl hydrolase family 32 [Sediminibacterium sp.]
MYSGAGFNDWEIGDITVILYRGVYHLFHLIIPNHDYIAHAVSADGISWRRINNALFVGNPGEWDDDMLWTMHVCEVNGKFEMYYTGLQRRDRGVVSKIGYAESMDLVEWEKKDNGIFPVGPKGIFYETMETNPRTWLSFRDPFRFEHNGEIYLLVDTRVLQGPVSRRGCVGMVKITGGVVELMPPLLSPMVYDDVECPCLFELDGKYYLLGSIREDIKVRYWFADTFLGEYHSFHNDVILPQGNYAARIVRDGEHLLVYNFFYAYGKIDALRVLPPPKQLGTDAEGRLQLKTYYRWGKMALQFITQEQFEKPAPLFNNPTASHSTEADNWVCGSRSGYEIFCFPKPSDSFIWEGTLTIEGIGKFGIVTDMDKEGNGYFISFNVLNNQAQIRAWGFNPVNHRQNFIFNDIQAGFFATAKPDTLHFRLIRFGHYIELSIDGIVILTLMDYTYSNGFIGLYASSAIISLQQSVIRILPAPEEEYASQESAQKLE